MSSMVDVIRRVVQQEMARTCTTMLGVVTEVFPHESEDDENNYEVSVHLKHEDMELTRIPMAVPYMGVAEPPKVEDLMLVQFLNGDLNQPVITGRFYHDGERPPLHHEDEVLFEQRVPDGTLNHLRFTPDGTIFLQRDVTNAEDNSEAKTSVKIDGETGDVEIKAGESIVITLTNDDNIHIVADGNPITVDCDQMNVNCTKMTVDGEMEVTGKVTAGDNVDIDGDLKVGTGPSTTISGNEITGG